MSEAVPMVKKNSGSDCGLSVGREMGVPEPVVIGDCTLYCGDALEVLPTLADINTIVTSPPYNQLGSRIPDNPTGMWGRTGGGKGWVDAVNDNGYTDDLDEHEYQQQQNTLFAAALQSCAPTASMFYNHQCRWRDRILLHPIDWFKPIGWNLRQEIIWSRSGGMMMNARMFCRFDERVLWFTRGEWKWNQASVGQGTVWHIPIEQNKEHPVAFPLELPTRCILATTDVGDLVCDPYMGSATTGMACALHNRRFVGIERRQDYFELACRRIREAYDSQALFRQPDPPSGQQAELIPTT